MSNTAAGMHLIVAQDYEQMSQLASEQIWGLLATKPSALLGIATGKSPLRTYQLLAERARNNPHHFSKARVLKVDEWMGLDMEHPSTCELYLREQVLNPWRIGDSRYCGWNSKPDNVEDECARMESWIAHHGPMDMCILGIGKNGHLALNEPSSSLQAHPHRSILTEDSRNHSMLKNAQKPPLYGLTIGVGDIMHSRHLLLLASGKEKAKKLKMLFSGIVTPRCPVSILQLHPDVTVICDREAASELNSQMGLDSQSGH